MADTLDTTQQDSSQQQGNLVILKDGSKHLFPAGTTVDQMHKALNLGPVPQSENWVDKLRPYIASGAGATAALGTSLIPVSWASGGIAQVAADTQGYALVDSLLKYLGANPPKSYTEALTGSEADAAVNAVAGKLVGTVFKGAKSLFSSQVPDFYKLAPTTSQALEKYGMKSLAQIPKFIEDYGVPAVKAKALDRSGGEGFTQALALANTIDKRTAGVNSNPQKLYDTIKGQLQLGIPESHIGKVEGSSAVTPGTTLHKASQEALDLLEYGGDHFDTLRNVIGNEDKLAKVLKVGQVTGSPSMNVKKDLAAFNFMDIVQNATTKDVKGGVRIDPSKLQTMWNDPERQASYDLLYNKETKKNITEFFKDIAYTQTDKSSNEQLFGTKYLRYGTAGKFIMSLSALQHGFTTGNFVPAGIIAGVQLTASTVGRLLTNPTTARIMTDMAKGKLTGGQTFTAKVLGNALRNTTVGLVSSDGRVTDGTFEENPETGTLEFKRD